MLSVLIPTFNEENAIEDTVRRVHDTFQQHAMPCDIIVIDDGSTDRTPAILARIHLPNLRVLTHAKNRGNGTAIRTGLTQSTGHLIATVDADNTYPIERLPELTTMLENEQHDMVVGARQWEKAMPSFLHRLGKACLRSLVETLAEADVPDPNSGMRVFRRSLAEHFLPIFPPRFSFHATLTVAALRSGYRVTYLPIPYYRRTGKSKLSGGPQSLLHFCRIVLHLLRHFPLWSKTLPNTSSSGEWQPCSPRARTPAAAVRGGP